MGFLILFDGKDYVVVPVREGTNPNLIVDDYPGYVILDNATSEEEAAIKIQRDRERNKPVWV